MDPVIISPTKQRFNDINYYFDGRYYTNKWSDKRRLHQRVWEDAHGPIPEGYHVHHINEDKADNRLENLECLSPSEHMAKHPCTRPWPKQARDAATEWHRSDEGRAWHRAVNLGKKAPRKLFVCIQCGKDFLAAHSRSGMCDQVCRKRRAAGLPGGATYRRPR